MLSVHEPTWNKELKRHMCCGSTHSPSHLSGCPQRYSKIPGRASDPAFLEVQNLKNQGYISRDVARILGMALAEVNDLWVA